MGIFQKLGLVEPADDIQPTQSCATGNFDYGDDVDVNLDEVKTDTLVSDVYAQNELYDQSKSIFKVEDLMNSLPKEMVTETKKNSVLSALGVFGLTSEEVIADGTKRVEILNAAIDKIVSERKAVIEDCQTRIESCKETIAELEKTIAEEEDIIKSSDKTIYEEAERIKKLISFIGGEA